MPKSATRCNETVGKWCKNKHGASKIIDTLETYHLSILLIPGLGCHIGIVPRLIPRSGLVLCAPHRPQWTGLHVLPAPVKIRLPSLSLVGYWCMQNTCMNFVVYWCIFLNIIILLVFIIMICNDLWEFSINLSYFGYNSAEQENPILCIFTFREPSQTQIDLRFFGQ
jgi:hypothetical protein